MQHIVLRQCYRYMKEIFDFLKALAADNSREWLNAHEEEFKRVKSMRDLVAQRFIDTVAAIDPAAARLGVKDVTYRFMRDTRFSADKSPYKTHIGIFVCPPYGKKSLLSGYYLHLEPGESIICGGNYGLPTKMLTAIRKDIRDNIEEYTDIVENPGFKEFFPSVGSDFLKTAPKGFDKDWRYIDYVRPREFGVRMHLPDKWFYVSGKNREEGMPDLTPIDRLLPMLKQIKRLNDFINFSIEESGQPLMRESR